MKRAVDSDNKALTLDPEDQEAAGRLKSLRDSEKAAANR
jgi:hypothetical protein